MIASLHIGLSDRTDQQGELPESVTLGQIGEWWIEVKQEQKGGIGTAHLRGDENA